MGKYSDAKVGFSGDRSSLAAGSYGTNKLAGLEIVSFVGQKPCKDPELIRYSYLVAATEEGATGTAFLAFNVNHAWLNDSVIALAFNMDGLPDKAQLEAKLGVKLETEADEKAAREGILAEAEQALRAKASAKAEANNAPETADKLYENLLMAARISIGTIFRLQDWQGYDRDALLVQYAPEKLIGCTFAGKVKASSLPPQATKEEIALAAKEGRAPVAVQGMEVDVFTCKVEHKDLKQYAYTVPEAAEGVPF